MKINAIKIYEPGGPDSMKWETVDIKMPSSNEVLIKHTFVGLNYIDTYHRSGLYPLPLPSGIGMEGSGIIKEIGSNVTKFKIGDRVVYASPPPGSYSQARLIPAEKVIKIPDFIKDDEAASILLKGMTVEYLIKRTYKVKKGQTVLFHAAAGGVGLLACQWLNSLGVKVIGTVGSKEKAELAEKHGCSHTILYKEQDFVSKVMEITNGKGVPVVYDGVGKDTMEKGLDCLSPLGMMVVFGNSSGNANDINPGTLAKKGSLFLTRPSLFNYVSTREDLELSSNDVFNAIKNNYIKPNINYRYDLEQVVQAHKDLENRKTTGSIVFKA